MFRSRGATQFVMAAPGHFRPGGVPATHALLGCAKDVGARHNPRDEVPGGGHDNREIVRRRDRNEL
jgi:hypothetical protein